MLLYMTPDVCVLRKGSYESVHEIFVVNIPTLVLVEALQILVSHSKTEILSSIRQGVFYSLMLFHGQWMLTADLLSEGMEKICAGV